MIKTDEVERNIMGSLMLSEDPVFTRNKLSMLKPEYFSSAKNRRLYGDIISLNSSLLLTDAMTIDTQFQGKYDIGRLLEVQSSVVGTHTLDAHIASLKRAWAKNETAKLAEIGANELFDNPDVENGIEKIVGELKKVQSEVVVNPEVTQHQLRECVIREAETNTSSEQKLIRTGNDFIDSRLHVFRGQVICIGGQSGFGKTALAQSFQLGQYGSGISSVYFCCETKGDELLVRLACQLSEMSFVNTVQDFRFGGKDRYLKALEYLNKRPDEMIIMGKENYRHTIEDIDFKLSQIAEKQRIDCVYIDYIQTLTKSGMQRKEQHQVIEACMNDIGDLAVKYNCLIVVLSQLNRQRELGSKPRITNLRGASAIENVCHVIAFIWQTASESEKECREKECLFYTDKTRLIQGFSIRLFFDTFCGRFSSSKKNLRYPWER